MVETPRQQLTKRTPVEIPDSSREVKARFWDEPPRAKVLEIRKYVSETGKAHLHPDVTYTPIIPGNDIRFLEVFDLVEKFKYDEDNWCVCAACKHDLPQFKEGGIICWFPSEGIIRIIGGDCYKRLNPERHHAAWKQYEADTRQRNDETYLLGALPVVPQLIDAMDHDAQIADALDKVRDGILRALDTYEIDLWPHIKDGKLKKQEKTRQIVHGRGEARTVVAKTVHAPVRGHKFLDPRYGKLAPRFRAAARTISTINLDPPHEAKVLAMSDEERRQSVGVLSKALKEIHGLRRELEDARKLISHESKATFRTWSSLPEHHDSILLRIHRHPDPHRNVGE